MAPKINEEKILKEKVIQSAEAVKKKVKLLRDMKTNDNIILESVLKPITEPLNEIVKSNGNSNNNNSFNTNETDFDEDAFKWKKTAKTLKFSPDDEKRSSINNHTVVHKSSESGSNNDDDISNGSDYSEDDDSMSCESDNRDGLESVTDTSFKTTDSFASPRENPAWKKQYNNNLNIPFGVRTERDKLMLGSYSVSVSGEKLKVNGNSYNLTPGLYDLLFKKLPDLGIITEDDKRYYKMLLLETNAHRRDFNPNKPIKSNKGKKYLYIIKPLFKLSKERLISDGSTHGQGLPTMKKVKRDVSYVYWDDPNELVERLKLLIASRDAGNTGLDNEIISIVEELREAGLVN